MVEYPMAAPPKKPARRPPIIERTESRGSGTIEFPVWGGSFKATGPATNRSLMLIIFAACVTIAVTASICCWLIFVEGSAENIEGIGSMFGRKPEKRQTPDGEFIEVCPPCPSCDDMGCMDMCAVCPQCVSYPPSPAVTLNPTQKIAPPLF